MQQKLVEEAKSFRATIDKYDRKVPFVCVRHGSCTDGAFGDHVACAGLRNMGFTVSLRVAYYHNTDNFPETLTAQLSGKHILFIDVTPTHGEYTKLKALSACTISVIDHHPFVATSPIGKAFNEDKVNFLSITDRSHCGTTLTCLVFDPELLASPLIYHVNRFDNLFLDDPVTKSVGCYNKYSMGNPEFCEVALKKSFADIVKEGQAFEKHESAKIKAYVSSGKKYSVELKGHTQSTEIFEVVTDDELLANNIADEFYATTKDIKCAVITICHIKGGTKFSFRSSPLADANTSVTAATLAKIVGGGGHPHCSAYFLSGSKVASYKEILPKFSHH